MRRQARSEPDRIERLCCEEQRLLEGLGDGFDPMREGMGGGPPRAGVRAPRRTPPLSAGRTRRGRPCRGPRRRGRRAACAPGSAGRAAASGARCTRGRARCARDHGSEARPWTCAQPVMPGATARRPRWRSVYWATCTWTRRARADDRHLAAQDVDEVRQLVDRGPPQDRADAGDARVALVHRQAGAHALGAVDHRAQLETSNARRRARPGAGGRSGARATRGGSRAPRAREPARRHEQRAADDARRPSARLPASARYAHRVPSGGLPARRACRGAASPKRPPRATAVVST